MLKHLILVVSLLLLPVWTAPAQAQFSRSVEVMASGHGSTFGGGFSNRGTLGQVFVGATSGGGLGSGAGYWRAVVGLNSGSVALLVRLRVLLEGAYDGNGKMRMDLVGEPGFPTLQPYGAPGFDGTPLDYDGKEEVFATEADWVDWLLVEVRSATTASSILGRQAVLLAADGRLLNTDGSQDIAFEGVPPNSGYLVVRHRNHLPAMSPALSFQDGTASHDFTGGSAFGSDAQADLGGGLFGLWAGNGALGDGSGSERIQPDDGGLWQTQFAAGAIGYVHQADYDLNGRVQPSDQAAWSAAFGAGAQSAVPEN